MYQDLRDVYSTLNDFDLSADEARRRVLLYLHGMSTQYGWGWAAPPQPLQGMTQAEKGAVNRGLTVTRAGRGVQMTGEAGHRLSLAMDDLSTLLMPGDILQNDDHIAAGHPGVEYLGNEGKGKGKGSPQPFTGQGNRLGE